VTLILTVPNIIMLSVAFFIAVLRVVITNVVMLSVVAPLQLLADLKNLNSLVAQLGLE
jgi:hypothetical protein